MYARQRREGERRERGECFNLKREREFTGVIRYRVRETLSLCSIERGREGVTACSCACVCVPVSEFACVCVQE